MIRKTAYAEDLTTTVSASETPLTKLSKSFTPDAGDNYFIFSSVAANVDNLTTRYNLQLQAIDAGTNNVSTGPSTCALNDATEFHSIFDFLQIRPDLMENGAYNGDVTAYILGYIAAK